MTHSVRTRRRARYGALAALGALAVSAAVAAPAPTEARYTDTATAAAETYTMPASYQAVSSQFTSTSAALSDGWVWVWGFKGQGMGGNGVQNDDDRSPQPVHGLNNVVKVVGASDISETPGTFGALTADGEVYTWGLNKLGRLGIGTTSGNNDFRATPQKVEFPDDEKVIDLGSMRATMAALTESGKVYTWGSGQYGQAGNGSTVENRGPHSPYLVIDNVHSMHVGQRLTWVITRENRVFWWGRAVSGEAGNGTTATVNNPNPLELPQLNALVEGCEGPAVPVHSPEDTCSVVEITSSRQAGAALTRDGVVHTFGQTANGQIGRIATAQTRVQVHPINIDEPVARLSAGNYHFTALTKSGGVWGWGSNASWAATGNIRPDGSTGQGTTNATTPVRLPLTDIVMIGGSRDTSYATRSDSVLIGWGDGRQGAIPGNETNRRTFTPLALPGIRVEVTE
ncbi:RCC1 domain-containing protein [Microbacterium thalli]|uniref:Alpha-tubulin suppressor n=1 Tax=Microbacterium thalli TaxID=3027921 RepID=A0ABT5SDQ7_9MICO|nr:hypothetical protein [Microbacterium thalli]MDD7960929.1 hypothetical protein [Microbacterium thalli]